MTTRAQFLEHIQTELPRRPVLILGGRGAGKTYLLQSCLSQLQTPAMYVPAITGAKKTLLLDLGRRLFDDKRLEAFIYFDDWTDVKKRLNRCTVTELAEVIIPHLSAYTLAIDNLDLATEKAIREIVLPFFDSGARLLMAANDTTKVKRRRVELIANHCVQLDVPPLTRAEARAMLWSTLERDRYRHWQVIESKVLNLYSGNPGVVADLAGQLAGTRGHLADIRALTHTETPVFDLTWITGIALLSLLMAGRFFARGLNDPTLYILAGLAYAVTIVARPLLWSHRPG